MQTTRQPRNRPTALQPLPPKTLATAIETAMASTKGTFDKRRSGVPSFDLRASRRTHPGFIARRSGAKRAKPGIARGLAFRPSIEQAQRPEAKRSGHRHWTAHRFAVSVTKAHCDADARDRCPPLVFGDGTEELAAGATETTGPQVDPPAQLERR